MIDAVEDQKSRRFRTPPFGDARSESLRFFAAQRHALTAARPQAARQTPRAPPATGLERPRWPKVILRWRCARSGSGSLYLQGRAGRAENDRLLTPRSDTRNRAGYTDRGHLISNTEQFFIPGPRSLVRPLPLRPKFASHLDSPETAGPPDRDTLRGRPCYVVPPTCSSPHGTSWPHSSEGGPEAALGTRHSEHGSGRQVRPFREGLYVAFALIPGSR